ncbi:Vacuolar segregation subunit 7 domain containing protein [Elaphomyces granulatus]
MMSSSDRPPALSHGSSGNTRASTRDQETAVSTSGIGGRSGMAVDGDTGEPPRSILPNQSPAMSQLPMFSPPVSISAPGSTANSTFSSRESSPARLVRRQSNSTPVSRASLSRKNSANISPHRAPGNVVTPVPSVAVLPASKHELPPPVVEPSLDVPGPEKSSMPLRALDSGLQGPPSSWRKISTNSAAPNRAPGSGTPLKRQEQESISANTSSKRSSLPPLDSDAIATKVDDVTAARSPIRLSGRGASGGLPTLETVQEASLPSTPAVDKALKAYPADPQLQQVDEDAVFKVSKQMTESGSDSGGNKSSGSREEKRRQNPDLPRRGDVPPKRSLTSLSIARGKPADGSARHMIVETETVSSVPQVSLGVGSGERGSSGRTELGGTIRMKSSVETIRPKKEKKKATRKPAPAPGTASSKADIFEAKVASAVDEADVSDSDETFVYESNPRDPHPARQYRYHSRTPSTTSMASQADQFGNRPRPGLREGPSVTGKRSMKFTNNNYNNSLDGEGGEPEKNHASTRVDTNGQSGSHPHIGRHGRSNAYPSLFDTDSSLTPAPRSPRHFIGSGFRPNRRGNPRFSPNYRTIPSPKTMGDYVDDFDADGADDERTPLVGSFRGPRNRHGRRPNSANIRRLEYLEERQRSCFLRYGGCTLASILALLLISGVATFLVAVTKPLLDVHINEIRNVLASEQEIMLDLEVVAINQNIFPIAIDDMDVNIFARSRYVGSEKFWREHGPHPDTNFPRLENSKRRAERTRIVKLSTSPQASVTVTRSPRVRIIGGVDRGTDPIADDPSVDPQTMLLGRVFTFDSPLIFEPSPWRRTPSNSSGEIRLSRPGNKTEEGGTERWERVLKHPFELIVRGVVKYSLPLSSSMQSASISSKVQVSPDQEQGGGDDLGDGIVHTPSGNDTVRINAARPSRSVLPTATLKSRIRFDRIFTA